MVGITVPLAEPFKERLHSFPWVNWSEIGREEMLKRDIFDKFIKTRDLSKKDQEFCDKIDWYPVDELELKEEFVKELKKSMKRSRGKAMTIEEFNKWCDEL